METGVWGHRHGDRDAAIFVRIRLHLQQKGFLPVAGASASEKRVLPVAGASASEKGFLPVAGTSASEKGFLPVAGTSASEKFSFSFLEPSLRT